MPTLRSHTHLQAAQIHAQSKACKRVCLPKHTADRNNAAKIKDRLSNDKNGQLVTRYIKNWADTTEIKGCSSLQTLYRFDSDVLRSAQLFIYRNRCMQVMRTDTTH